MGVPIGIQRPSKTQPPSIFASGEEKVGKGRERCLKGTLGFESRLGAQVRTLVELLWNIVQCKSKSLEFEVLSSTLPGDNLPDPPPDPGRLHVVTSGTYNISP